MRFNKFMVVSIVKISIRDLFYDYLNRCEFDFLMLHMSKTKTNSK